MADPGTNKVGDSPSTLFNALSGFWQRFFQDTADLQAYYQASETYLGQVYLDLMASVLNLGIVDTPVFNKEQWKLFTIDETELNYHKGFEPAQDRYVYDMPGSIVSTDFLQNTIFDPTYTLDRDVDYEILDDDGFIRFRSDPFRQALVDGVYTPAKGVAWRYVRKRVGNRFLDYRKDTRGYFGHPDWFASGVRRGDKLRLIATRGALTVQGLQGVFTAVPGAYTLQDVGLGNASKPGDMLEVYGHAGAAGDPDDAFIGQYVVKAVLGPNTVQIDEAALAAGAVLPAASTNHMYWRAYTALYLDTFGDYEIDYLRDSYMIGSAGSPFPVTGDTYIYAVVRETPYGDVRGVPIAFESNPLALYPRPMPMGVRHIIEGSVAIYARVTSTNTVPQLGIDYTVDYLNGIIYQLTPWSPLSVGRCTYRHLEEVLYGVGGTVDTYPTGDVKQLSLWAADVRVDRFTLYYNYGHMLNRFEASSEAYRAFLRGIMYLYMSGPILQRIESAMNVAARFPVVRYDGEIVQRYFDGIDASGDAATISGTDDTVTIGPGGYLFEEADVGSVMMFENPLNDVNKGKFVIQAVNMATNTATLVTTYGLVDESPVSWKLSRESRQVVYTDVQEYHYPLEATIREDVVSDVNWGHLVVNAFDALTTSFRVTDYVEDPHWWHGYTIPRELWHEDNVQRRKAISSLVAHVIGPEDPACIGDPGLYIGADEDGVVSGPGVPINRHRVAFVLFDRYLKAHTFKITIDGRIGITPELRDDLEELVFIAKPAYTYPIISVEDQFIDNVHLTELFDIPHFGLLFGTPEDGLTDTFFAGNNVLRIGDRYAPFYIGDGFRGPERSAVTWLLGSALIPGTTFTIPMGAYTAGSIPVKLAFTDVVRAVDGIAPIEHRDYTVKWDWAAGLDAWRVTLLTAWIPAVPTELTGYVWVVEREPAGFDPALGWTPVVIGGLNPWYNRLSAHDPDSSDYEDQWRSLRTEFIEHPLQLQVVDPGP